ncbi:MAG: Rha family transcriptional regulator [Sulfurimonas sp.]|nr:Rha family transcriptional regulator [Sulfurimonas sp.]
MELIEIKNEVAVVSHRVIAEHTENNQRSLRLLIDKHFDDFKDFGEVGFEIHTLQTSGGAQEAKTYYLNEQQATLLMTYMQNTPIVRKFKKALVKAFYQLKAKSAMMGESQPLWLISKALETMLTQQASILMLLEQKLRDEPVVNREFVYIDKPTSRMNHHRLSNEEKFIAKVVKALELEEGITQGELLRRAGKIKADKTALNWLRGYDGIYWRANVINGNTYSYSLIKEA